MASSKSAFKLCLPSECFDIFMETARDPELLDVKLRINQEKCKKLNFKEEININLDLVNFNNKSNSKWTSALLPLFINLLRILPFIVYEYRFV